HVTIPTNPEYGVLNVSAAIQVICYELRMALLGTEVERYGGPTIALPPVEWDEEPAAQHEVNYFLEHLQQTLAESGFLDPEHPAKVMPRMQRLFMRTQLDKAEVGMLRGILKSFQRKMQ